jgi:hypothetical protein
MIIALVIAIAAAAAVLQAGFLSALGAPFDLLHLVLILIIGLVTGFRFRLAMAGAVVAGAVLEALTPAPWGSQVVILAVVAAALITLFTRIFTHLSLPAFIGINAAGFILVHAMTLLVDAAGAALAGTAIAPLFALRRLIGLGIGLGFQTVAAIAVLFAARKMKRMFFSSFIVVH